jgi:trans-aconitate methyltransferase
VQETVARMVLAAARSGAVPRRVLDVGAGTGILTEMLAREWPEALIEAVELSPAMVSVARMKSRCRRVRWTAGDIRTAAVQGPFDLIASSSALHWVQPLDGVLTRLAALAAPAGRLVLALMVRGTFAELHRCRAAAVPHKPGRDFLPHEREVRQALERAGARLDRCERSRLSCRAASVDAFFRALHDQGLTAAPAMGSEARSAATPPLLTRCELQALKERYRREYADRDGTIPVTYEVLLAAGTVEKP